MMVVEREESEEQKALRFQQFTLRVKRYDSKLEKEIRKWIQEFLSIEISPKQTFHEALKDGVILCDIINKIVPGTIKTTIHRIPSGKFRQIENITSYLTACAKLGLDPSQLFDAVDLVEGKNMMRVLQNLSFISRYCKTVFSESDPDERKLKERSLSVSLREKKYAARIRKTDSMEKRKSIELTQLKLSPSFLRISHENLKDLDLQPKESKIESNEQDGPSKKQENELKEDSFASSPLSSSGSEKEKVENDSTDDGEHNHSMEDIHGSEPSSPKSPLSRRVSFPSSNGESPDVSHENIRIRQKRREKQMKRTKEYSVARHLRKINRNKALLPQEEKSLSDLKDSPERHLGYVLRMVKLLLENSGVPATEIDHITSRIILSYKSPSKRGPSLLSSDQRSVLEHIKNATEEYITNEYALEKVVKVQSVVRRRLVSKQYSHLTKEYRRKLLRRNAHVRELVYTERRYVQELKKLMQNFLQPLRKSAVTAPILSPGDMAFIFSNIEDICQIHEDNLNRLNQLCDKWPLVDGIGNSFLKIYPLLSKYLEYVRNFEAAMSTLSRVSKDEKFSHFLHSVYAQMREKRDLTHLLSLPLNHVAKFLPVLDSISESTPDDFVEDSQQLKKACELMSNLCVSIDKSLSESKNLADICNIQRRIIGVEGPFSLLKTNRIFITEGSLMTVTRTRRSRIGGQTVKKKPVHLFLFNDACIITKPTPKGFELKKELSFDNISVVDVSDSSSMRFAFEIQKKDEHYVFIAKSLEEKISWIDQFQRILDKQNQDRIFAIPLSQVLKKQNRETGIPEIVEKIIDYFLGDIERLKVEGLFRLGTGGDELMNIKKMVDSGNLHNLDFDHYGLHAPSSLLKLFLRELPEPLFPFDAFDDLMEVERKEIEEHQTKLGHLKKVLQTLPRDNYRLLRHLCIFLHRVSLHSEDNKMNISNLAIVFGPTLLRPKVETMETSMIIPNINSIVQFCITHHHDLFSTNENGRN